MSKSDFESLAELNVNEHTESKNGFTYLSWAWAHQYLGKLDPDFDWFTHDFLNAEGSTMPYMQTPAGCFVRVTVTFKGKARTHTYPVIDHRNK